jgi:hypothetical protein
MDFENFDIDEDAIAGLAGAGFWQQAGTFLLGQTQAVQPLQATAEQRTSPYTPVYIAAGVGVVLLLVILFVLFKK